MKKIKEKSLYLYTLELLQNRSAKLQLKIIADETGLSEDWLSKFNLGKSRNPSVNAVQILFEYLTKSELDLYSN